MATAYPPRTPLPFVHPDNMPQRYALRGVGRCMEPVITDGALMAFDKDQLPEPGDGTRARFRLNQEAPRC